MLLENGRKESYEPIAKRWIEDPDYRDSQQEHGWTLEYHMFLDYLKTININYKATRRERDRYKNQFVVRWKDPPNWCKMSIHEDVKEAVKSRATMIHQQGRESAKILPSQRFRQRPVNEQLRSQLQWWCQQWRRVRGTQAPSSSSSSTTWWNPQQWEETQQWEERHQWQERQDWHGWQEWYELVEISWVAKSLCKFLCQSVDFFCCTCRVQTSANVMHATAGEDRTPHGTQHTRMFFSMRAV